LAKIVIGATFGHNCIELHSPRKDKSILWQRYNAFSHSFRGDACYVNFVDGDLAGIKLENPAESTDQGGLATTVASISARTVSDVGRESLTFLFDRRCQA